jgi:hypothetical protein
MATIARLRPWHHPAVERDLNAIYTRRLAPLLARHAVGEPIPCPRPAALGVLGYLCKLPDPTAVQGTAGAKA